MLYGRGEASIGEQLHCSTEEAFEIKDSVFKGFPAIKAFEDQSLDMAHNEGYVTTVCGRKRRLPDMQLPTYEFKWDGGAPQSVDLLSFDKELSKQVPKYIQDKYLRLLNRSKYWEKGKIFERANNEDGVRIVDNSKIIADTTRQCVNARIQGSAADLTKLAMIELDKNEHLKELGFRILIPVHDELICECPEENIKECSELLSSTMSKAAEEILNMPIKTDVAITKVWYGDEVNINEAN